MLENDNEISHCLPFDLQDVVSCVIVTGWKCHVTFKNGRNLCYIKLQSQREDKVYLYILLLLSN